MAEAKRDKNMVTTLIGVSSADGITPVTIYVDPSTHRMLVSAAAGTLDSMTDVVITAGEQGDILYFDGTDWVNLNHGTTGQVLTTGGHAANPSWSAAGSGDVQGPASATDGAIVLFDGTTGKLIKNSIYTPASFATALGADDNYVTDAEKTVIGNTSGTNSGDNATNSQYSGLAASKEDVSNKSTDTSLGTSDTLYPSQNAVKQYVDTVAQGLSAKPSAIVATTEALPTFTYNNGASGVGATITAVATGAVTVDGRELALNDVILVKNETAGNAPYNGLYTVTTAGAIGVALILTRHINMNTASEFPGGFIFIETGTANEAAGFVCTNSTNPTVGTTAITFTQFSGAGQITAGSALTKTGNTLDVAVDGSTIEVNTDALRVKDAGITYAKIQNVTTARLLGRTTAGSGVVEELSSADTFVSAASLTVAGKVELATTAEINTGTDTGRAMPVDQFVASNRNVRYLDFYLIDSATDLTTGTGKGGNFECPFTGTITAVGAYVNTAGTTNASVIDINIAGTTIMTTNKCSIDSAETSTRTAATAPTLTTTAITAGDLLSFDIDSLSTTAPKGLHVRVEIRLT